MPDPNSPDSSPLYPSSPDPSSPDLPFHTPAAGPSSNERTLGLVAHGLSFVEGGVIGPLILYLVKRDESEFVAFHALQSLYFGLLAVVIIGPITFMTCGFGAVLVVPYLVFEAIACVEANNGNWYELPIVGPLALRSHHP